jgi:putative transposase
LGEIFYELAKQKECKIEEGHLMSDHVHMLISIPPKYSVAQIVGFFKGEECNFNCTDLPWKKKEFYRTKFLGKRLSCVYGWKR